MPFRWTIRFAFWRVKGVLRGHCEGGPTSIPMTAFLLGQHFAGQDYNQATSWRLAIVTRGLNHGNGNNSRGKGSRIAHGVQGRL
jgi:hypothetical protein